jgi:anti-sigma factor RsiW
VSALSSDDDLACRELVELVTEYLEGALDASARARIDAHLADCDGCATYVDQVRATVAAAHRLPAPPVPRALLARLLEAFRSERREV